MLTENESGFELLSQLAFYLPRRPDEFCRTNHPEFDISTGILY